MKSPRIIALLLSAVFGTAGITEAAVIRRQSEDAVPATQKMEQRATADDLISNSSDGSSVELMKKKKKTKPKKSKAS